MKKPEPYPEVDKEVADICKRAVAFPEEKLHAMEDTLAKLAGRSAHQSPDEARASLQSKLVAAFRAFQETLRRAIVEDMPRKPKPSHRKKR